MYRRLATTSLGRGFHAVPVTIFSALSFQRLPATFRRTPRAKTAPFSNPMMCSSSMSDFSSQIAVRQRLSCFVRSAVLGSLYHIVSPNIAMPDVYSRPLSREYPFRPSARAQDPSTMSDQPRQQWRPSRDLQLRFLFSSRCENISLVHRVPCSCSQPDPYMARNTLVDTR